MANWSVFFPWLGTLKAKQRSHVSTQDYPTHHVFAGHPREVVLLKLLATVGTAPSRMALFWLCCACQSIQVAPDEAEPSRVSQQFAPRFMSAPTAAWARPAIDEKGLRRVTPSEPIEWSWILLMRRHHPMQQQNLSEHTECGSDLHRALTSAVEHPHQMLDEILIWCHRRKSLSWAMQAWQVRSNAAGYGKAAAAESQAWASGHEPQKHFLAASEPKSKKWPWRQKKNTEPCCDGRLVQHKRWGHDQALNPSTADWLLASWWSLWHPRRRPNTIKRQMPESLLCTPSLAPCFFLS